MMALIPANYLHLRPSGGTGSVRAEKIVDGGLAGRIVKDLSGFYMLAGVTRQRCRSIIRQCSHVGENLTGLAVAAGAERFGSTGDESPVYTATPDKSGQPDLSGAAVQPEDSREQCEASLWDCTRRRRVSSALSPLTAQLAQGAAEKIVEQARKQDAT